MKQQLLWLNDNGDDDDDATLVSRGNDDDRTSLGKDMPDTIKMASLDFSNGNGDVHSEKTVHDIIISIDSRRVPVEQSK